MSEKQELPPPYFDGAQPPMPPNVPLQPMPPMQQVPMQPMMGGPTIIVNNAPVGPQAMPYTCRSCNAQIVTRVQRNNVTKTHLFALLLCAIGCWPCCFIPYCVDTCKSIDHYCPNCQAYVGSYNNN